MRRIAVRPGFQSGSDIARITRRRTLLYAVVSCPLLGWTGTASSQAKSAPVVVCWLSSGASDGRTLRRYRTAFREGMAELGWMEGSNYIVEGRFAEGRVDRLDVLAEELRPKRCAVVVATTGAATIAAAKASPNLPIVQLAGGSSPVDLGLAVSLARPGGRVTGLTNIAGAVSEKYLELLIAAVPGLRRIGFLLDSASRAAEVHRTRAQKAAAYYRVDVRFGEARQPEELEPAIAQLAKEGMQALVVVPSAWFTPHQSRILKQTRGLGWPVAGFQPDFAVEGVLLSYGADTAALYRRTAWYVDRILKGTKPGDLPIEQPTKFELVVNLKTAKTLGITIPQAVLVQATRVIE